MSVPGPFSAEGSEEQGPDSTTIAVDERLQIMRNGVINYMPLLTSQLVGLALVPSALAALGNGTYGVWVSASALAGMFRIVDLGLGSVIIREVASTPLAQRNTLSRLVSGATMLYAAVGAAGGAAIAAAGLLVSLSGYLANDHPGITRSLFALTGLAFFGDHALSLPVAVLHGCHRFRFASMFLVLLTTIRGLGMILLLASGMGVLMVVSWQAIITLTAVLILYVLLSKTQPGLSLRFGRWHWNAVGPHLRFGISTLLSTLADKAAWEVLPLIIGITRGPTAVVPYQIGQKFPLALAGICWRSADVLFPTASRYRHATTSGAIRTVLEIGLRWLLLLVLPGTIILWTLAPNLLTVWVGSDSQDAVLVLRLIALAVAAESLGASAYYVLWANGATRYVLVTVCTMAAATLILSGALVPLLGPVGAAIALLVPVPVGAGLLLSRAARICQSTAAHLLAVGCKGLWLPALSCCVTTVLAAMLLKPAQWSTVIACGVVGIVVFVAVLYLRGAREEERKLILEVLHLTKAVSPSRFHEPKH